MTGVSCRLEIAKRLSPSVVPESRSDIRDLKCGLFLDPGLFE